MIEWMDAQFGRVIEKLEHLNVLDDLSKDPDERNNLIDTPAYADALSRLRAKAEALPEPRRKDENNRFIDPYRPIVKQ